MTDQDLYNLQSDIRDTQLGIAAEQQKSTVARIVSVVYAVFALLELLLLTRVILHLLGAGTSNDFAGGIYILSAPFMALFANLLQNPALGTTAVLEINTIGAMIAYAILAWMLGRVIQLWGRGFHVDSENQV